jgi:NADH dehydrogenase
MILLTGGTGATGRRVLDALLLRGHRVRCLVRHPARLGTRRVDVGLALWNLTDARLPGGALRGVDTVVHLAGPLSDQPIGQLEELNATASWRLADAAAAAGVRHFVHVSALGAGEAVDSRFLRAKRTGERVVAGAGTTGGMAVSIVAPSLILARGQRWASWAQALALLPAVPVPSRGTPGRSRPIGARDLADALVAVVEGAVPPIDAPARHEIAGPTELTIHELVPALLSVIGRPRRTVHLPTPLLRVAAAALERPGVTNREELAILGCDTAGRHGTRGAEALGVRPAGLSEALS